VALAVGVAALTAVSSEQAVHDLAEDLTARASSYGAVVAGELGPAIARGDGDAIRRILDVLPRDPDIVAVTLRNGAATEIYRHGIPGPWQPVDIVAAEVFETHDRLAAAMPVPVPGQRRALLTIELSTAQLHAHRRTATWMAILAGTAALVFGVLARRVIARSVVHRLRAIVEVEEEVDATGAENTPGQPHDEIAIFGDAFHQMLTRLRRDQVRLRATVSELTAVQDQLARINGELECRVALRTGELIDANRQLHDEMRQRSQMEVELRQAQKLESVGRLASGIAHEINTPVQFVSDSCSFLETATDDLINLIGAYRGALDELDRATLAPAAAAARLRGLETERDVAYMIDQIPLAIRRALQGLERVSAIVHAMKDFAYPDHQDQAPADLNRAILSTLTVARNEYKYIAEVHTELGDLPHVTCHIGELNQVILNLVVNSAHAIESAKAEHERDGQIVIRTRDLGEHVAIEVEDNGCGIPPENFDKIFDPFFTTKEIGKGTGQGLAIARSVVVDKHRGKIDVASRVGYGTTFTITLPVHGHPDTENADGGQSIPNLDDSSDRGIEPLPGDHRVSA
jgi:signal transduction histidine kinase